MALEQVNDLITVHVPTEEPTEEPGFKLNDRKWTKSSSRLVWKEGAVYCVIRDTNLQTLDDALEFRLSTNGADYSAKSQATRTLVGYVNDGLASLRAFVWEPTLEQLQELIKNPQISNAYLQISVRDALAKQLMEGA